MLASLLRRLADRLRAAPARRVARALGLLEAGRYDAARAAAQALLRDARCGGDARYLLGRLAEREGQAQQAAEHFRIAAELKPDEVAFLVAFAAAVDRLETLSATGSGMGADALAACRKALRLLGEAPTSLHVLLWQTEAALLQRQGELEAAAQALGTLLAVHDGTAPRLKQILLLPQVYRDREHIRATGEAFGARADALLARAELAPLRDPVHEVNLAPFAVAYRGENPRPLLERYARLVRRVYPVEPPPAFAPPAARPRVVFVSSCFHGHSVARTTWGFIRHLPRAAFQVAVVAINPRNDAWKKAIEQAADEYVTVGTDLAQAVGAIRRLRPDVLVYADIGMDPMTYFLAFWRLAPVQMTTWGHSVTSGIDSIDYYLSSRQAEADDAQQHYSEKLLLYDGCFAAAYQRPVLPPPRERAQAYGLPDGYRYYVCPQTLFKLHPDFDPVLRAILERDERGQAVLIEQSAVLRRQLDARLRRSLGPAFERVRYVPRMDHAGYLGLLAAADVIVDPPYFGGCNSTLEAFAAGTPVVAQPSPYLAGRFTYAASRELGIDDLVCDSAAELAERAVRIASDRDYRAFLSGRILARAERLFERIEPVESFADELRALLG